MPRKIRKHTLFMVERRLVPDFIFESSWEVCNKMGGIYTVLSTRAKTLQEQFPDKLMFIGPDVWQGKENPLFLEDATMWQPWVKMAAESGLHVRTGRWNIPGKPCVVLVDFQPYFEFKNDIYGSVWNDFGVDSLHAYGDYDEANMFSIAAALVLESFFHYYLGAKKQVVYQAHEWMTCLGALYIKKHVPEIATIFTTHATSIGRSIAGNNKPLYDYLWAYNGTQMAGELNMEAKHSIERQTAHNVDCFTTVSDVTGRECAELLDKQPDVILPNGFEADFVPTGAAFTKRRKEARAKILQVANALTGAEFTDDTLIVATSGRYEYRNKGIDVFLEAAYRSLYDSDLQRPVLMLIQVPAWVESPRTDLQERLKLGWTYTEPLPDPVITHNLHEDWNDPVLNFLRSHGMKNDIHSRVKGLTTTSSSATTSQPIPLIMNPGAIHRSRQWLSMFPASQPPSAALVSGQVRASDTTASWRTAWKLSPETTITSRKWQKRSAPPLPAIPLWTRKPSTKCVKVQPSSPRKPFGRTLSHTTTMPTTSLCERQKKEQSNNLYK